MNEIVGKFKIGNKKYLMEFTGLHPQIKMKIFRRKNYIINESLDKLEKGITKQLILFTNLHARIIAQAVKC
jgi:hypothetical protein